MWQQWMMLLGGNLVIGTIEGLVIGKVFKASYAKTIPLLIVANYASMWVGALLFGIGEESNPIPDNVFDNPLARAGALLWICVAIAIVLSVVIEWPFCLAALPRGAGRLKRSVGATLIAKASSYLCIGLTHIPARNTVGRDFQVVRWPDLNPLPARGHVYFIDPSDGDVYSIGLDGSGRQRRFHANLIHVHDVLGMASMNEGKGPPWRLIGDRFMTRDDKVLATKVAGIVEPFRMNPYENQTHIVSDGRQLGFCGIADHRPADRREWQPQPSGNSGLVLTNSQTNERLALKYDTAFASWYCRCVTVLPGDVIVFEFGQQVCTLDINQRKIALLTRGRGPVVVLDEKAIANSP